VIQPKEKAVIGDDGAFQNGFSLAFKGISMSTVVHNHLLM